LPSLTASARYLPIFLIRDGEILIHDGLIEQHCERSPLLLQDHGFAAMRTGSAPHLVGDHEDHFLHAVITQILVRDHELTGEIILQIGVRLGELFPVRLGACDEVDHMLDGESRRLL